MQIIWEHATRVINHPAEWRAINSQHVPYLTWAIREARRFSLCAGQVKCGMNLFKNQEGHKARLAGNAWDRVLMKRCHASVSTVLSSPSVQHSQAASAASSFSLSSSINRWIPGVKSSRAKHLGLWPPGATDHPQSSHSHAEHWEQRRPVVYVDYVITALRWILAAPPPSWGHFKTGSNVKALINP